MRVHIPPFLSEQANLVKLLNFGTLPIKPLLLVIILGSDALRARLRSAAAPSPRRCNRVVPSKPTMLQATPTAMIFHREEADDDERNGV
mmetsp:Transcript_7005/g.13078  ORF Transcript_7005/g.13078 Transcript_7005/m.13078 type:complete len:89 (+) Transcript_7005:57-323(+)